MCVSVCECVCYTHAAHVTGQWVQQETWGQGLTRCDKTKCVEKKEINQDLGMMDSAWAVRLWSVGQKIHAGP